MVHPPPEVEFERRVLAELDRVLDAPLGAQQPLLAELEASDPLLGSEVRALFDLDREAGPISALGQPAVDDLIPYSADHVTAGHRIGTYELIRPIGSGGMGHVFEAMQERPRRRVALKVLRFGLISQSARRRFEVESETLARLRHPGIAQVYEAGVHREECATGPREIPYFALEYVDEARTIVEYVRVERLDHSQLLVLFAAVCDAVHHGHQRGVIHRDLKAANVLVGKDGLAKVIDFGVARATGLDEEQRQKTNASELVGTLSSMSPEQLVGDPEDLDLRCDVYGLGALLYELLSGRMPHDVARLPLHEATRRIVEEAPAALRTLLPDLPRELETICRSALARVREDRYPSAHELASDVRRFLRHEPIHAQPVAALRRATLFIRRHRLGVGAAVLIVGTLIVASVTGLSLAARRKDALAEAALLEKVLLGFTQDVTLEFLEELAQRGVSTQLRAQLVQSAIERLGELERQAGDDPEVLAVLVDSFLQLGSLQGSPFSPNLGDAQGAERSFLRARELIERLRERDPTDFDLRLTLVRADLLLADVETNSDGPDGSARRGAAAMELCEDLLSERPLHPEARLLHARALATRGYSLHTDPDGMMRDFAQAEAIYRGLLEGRGEDHFLYFELATTLASAGTANTVFGRHAAALDALGNSIDILQRALELSPGNVGYRREIVKVSWYLAAAMEQAGEPPSIILPLAQMAASDARRLQVFDPDDILLKRNALNLCLVEGRAHLRLARADSAPEALERAFDCVTEAENLISVLEEQGVPLRDDQLGRSLVSLQAMIEAHGTSRDATE